MEDLTVVIPVYNEEDQIVGTLDSWITILRKLSIVFKIDVYNDGSTDKTLEKLSQYGSQIPEIKITNKKNSGHGPTILMGYRSSQSHWIFQADSDSEVAVSDFPLLWEKRNGNAFVLGLREKVNRPFVRRLVSSVARWMVSRLFGSGIHDVNCPFRLYRTDAFRQVFQDLPDDTLAPNVLLSAWAVHNELPVAEVPVRFSFERNRKSTLNRLRLLTFSTRAFFQAVRFWWRLL